MSLTITINIKILVAIYYGTDFSMTKEDINKMMMDHDTKIWKKTLEEKSTLKYYKEG